MALAALPVPAGAEAVGSEFQINTYTTAYQRTGPRGNHVVAADASGNFVVVWESLHQDRSEFGVFGQRYDSAGVALGNEYRVNSYTPDSQRSPSVSSDARGNFVVVWGSLYQEGPSDSYSIFGQRYDSEGDAQGEEFRVNADFVALQWHPSVASAANGNFVVVWSGRGQGDYFGVFGRQFDLAGSPQGSEFRVNSFTTLRQDNPSVASDSDGNFVVVWSSDTQDGSSLGVFGQRFDITGEALGNEFRVNSFTTGYQWVPAVASDAEGNFVVVWASYAQDGSSWGIFGQRYDKAGVAVGGEFRVNTFTPSYQGSPSVAADADGNFVVVWDSPHDGDSSGIFGQRYDSAGVPQGTEFQINSFTTGPQLEAAVAATGTNGFVVAWDSYGQDGSDWGVFGQRFDFAGDTTPPSVTVDAPNGGERLFTGSSYMILWTGSDDTALSSFDVSASTNGGDSYTPIAECQELPGSSTSCLWLAPGPPSGNALVRVTAADTSGNTASDASDAVFRIVPEAASITVVSPNANVRWRIGTLQSIRWTHNLGPMAAVRIELDRQNDGTFEELVADGVPAGSPTKGSFAWTVTGPPAATARIRVLWTGNPAVSDQSDMTFQIRGAGVR